MRRHFFHYLILLLVFAAGLFGFGYFRFRPQMQLVVVGLTVLSYIAWGVIHHHFEDRLRREVIGEYFLIGVLVFVMFALTLLR